MYVHVCNTQEEERKKRKEGEMGGVERLKEKDVEEEEKMDKGKGGRGR